MLSALARLAARRPRRVVALAVLFALAAGVLGGPVAGELPAGTGDFQDPGAENLTAKSRIERATGTDDRFGVIALVESSRDVRRDPSARAAVERAARTIRAERGFDRVLTWYETRAPTLVARDGRAASIAARWRGPGSESTAIDRLKPRLARQGVRLGGEDVVFREIDHTVSHDLARAELIAFPLLFLLALWVFRGAVAALLPPLVGGLAIVGTFLALRIVHHQVTGVSIFALNLVTGAGLGLAIDYSLFIVSRYREEIARVGPGAEALRRTLATAGRTVLYSSLTVAAAMASLLVFPLRFLYSMGIGGAIVALLAAAVSLVVLPAILALLGPRVNALAPRWLQRSGDREAREEASGGWYRLSRAVMHHPGPIALACTALLVAVGLPFLRIQFGPADAHVLPTGSPSRQVSEALQRDFPPSRSEAIEVVAGAPRSAAAQVGRYAGRLRAVAGRAPVARPVALDARTWRIDVIPRGDAMSAANKDLVRRVRAVPAPFSRWVGGRTAAFLDQQSAIGARLPVSLALLSLTTLAVLFLMTGSVVLPLKALVMNLLTLSAAFGLLVLIFQDGRLEGLLDFQSSGALEATQPVLLFAIAFGLSTDYGVFLLSRIKEARDTGMSNREAVAHGVERTGRIVTAAALLFCVAISAFSTSGVVFIKELGIGTALAVAIDASIVRALLVPSLMELLGEWNWWAPRPLRRLHARIGLHEGEPGGAAA